MLWRNIELKNTYMKNEKFLKWNNWKNFFLLFPTVYIFDFCKTWTPFFTFYFWLINLWWWIMNICIIIIMNMFWKLMVFQVSLNFDPMKEILKIGCQIYILMKKGIILRLHHSSTISVWVWTEKKCDNGSHEKETKHIHASAADLLHTVFANADIAKMKREK